MQLGICAAPDALTAPAPEGLAFLEVNVQSFLMPAGGEEQFAANLDAALAGPVPVEAANGFFPGSMKTTGPEADSAVLDEYVATVLQRAKRAGIRIIVFGSGGSRELQPGVEMSDAIDQLADHLSRWAPRAAEADVTIVVEPLSDCSVITSVAEGAELVRRVGHPHFRLLADTWHMALTDDPPAAIEAAGELIAHVHVAEKQDRAVPGTHGEDLRPYFRALKAAGYDGRVSIEARWTDLPAQTGPALAALAAQISET